MAEIMARIMYIVRRKGMRLVMVMDDVEEMVMCPLKLVICTPAPLRIQKDGAPL